MLLTLCPNFFVVFNIILKNFRQPGRKPAGKEEKLNYVE